jgi:phage FluMu protein Com
MSLASILHIYCDKCSSVNDVKISQTHKAGTRGPLAFDNNSWAANNTWAYGDW